MKKTLIFTLIFTLICFRVLANEQVTICVNGVDMQIKGILKEERTFVPIRFVAENLDAEVLWNEEENAVYINEKSDEIILQTNWYDKRFEEMMQIIFEDEGLNFNNVHSKSPFEYAYKDENVGALTYTQMGMNGKLFVELFGEGTKESKEITVSSIWYFNIETWEYGKICGRYSPSTFYEDERFSPLFVCEDFEENIHLFDTKTNEKWLIPGGKILGTVGHNVYYLKDRLYVKNLKNGEEQSFNVEFLVDDIYRSYTDGKRIFIRQKSTEDDIFVLDLTTFEVTKCSYSETQFDYFGRSIFGIQKTADPTKPPRIFVNNMPVYNIPDIFLLKDRLYVPLRFVAEEMSADVVWIDGENKVEITNKLREIPRYAFSPDDNGEILKYN